MTPAMESQTELEQNLAGSQSSAHNGSSPTDQPATSLSKGLTKTFGYTYWKKIAQGIDDLLNQIDGGTALTESDHTSREELAKLRLTISTRLSQAKAETAYRVIEILHKTLFEVLSSLARRTSHSQRSSGPGTHLS
jgi:hypothetical protein